MKRKLLTTIPLTIALAAGAQRPTPEQLESKVDEMQKTIQDLQQQIRELKQEQHLTPTSTEPVSSVATNQTIAISSNTVVFSQTVTHIEGHAAQVTPRNTFNDQQEAAPRSKDLTLDPQYRGFIP